MMRLQSSCFMFQFHIGSIQAASRPLFHSHSSHSFNSTLVRFKPDDAALIGSNSSGFNSTLVRFKPYTRTRHQAFNRVSIPHWFDSSAEMGRLKRPRHGLVSIPHWFDSSRRVGRARAACDIGFNSTLVRFKPLTESILDNSYVKFQFHIGSIQASSQPISCTS